MQSPMSGRTAEARSRGAFACPHCTWSFAKHEHLKRHVRCHTRERPYACDHCAKTYARRDTLTRHQRLHAHNHRSQPAQSPSAPPADAQAPLPSFSADAVDVEPRDLALYHESDVFPEPAIDVDLDAWHLGHDFDLAAVDSALTDSLAGCAWTPNPPPPPPPPHVNSSTALPSLTNLSSDELDLEPTSAPNDRSSVTPVSRDRHVRWFSSLPNDGHSTPHKTPPTGQPLLVDEGYYRNNIVHQLQPPAYKVTLPSIEFLNVCLRLYFSRFHPMFPILHAPTFQPRVCNALLLLSICSIGALFEGSHEAKSLGAHIFTRLNKAILASWEDIMIRHKAEALAMVQAALLGQTFGMLSKRPEDSVMVDAFHGTLLAWSRAAAKRIQHDVQIPAEDINPDQLNMAWLEWSHAEQVARLTLALRIHDAELAALFHHHPLLRHDHTGGSRMLANDTLFEAPNPAAWLSSLKQQQQQQQQQQHTVDAHDNDDGSNDTSWISSRGLSSQRIRLAVCHSELTAYAFLESINAAILESRHSGSLGHASTNDFTSRLMLWRKIRLSSDAAALRTVDTFDLQILWHLAFISLWADLDLLERAVGRDGMTNAKECLPQVRTWANSTEGWRCRVHAMLLHESVEALRIVTEPCLHTPRGLYHAGLVWKCCNHAAGTSADPPRDLLTANFPEIDSVDSTATQRVLDRKEQRGDLPRRIGDLLLRFGRWGICQIFADILSARL